LAIARVTLPTVTELVAQLKLIIDQKTENPLSQFTFWLSSQVRSFLKAELDAVFPAIKLNLRYGDNYRTSLREAGLSERQIEGSRGIYIGNAFTGEIFVDLEPARQLILKGEIGSAIVDLSALLIEEYSHSIAPKVMDAEMADQTIKLTEKFLPDFKYSDEDKKAIHDSLVGEPKDGLFEPDFGGKPG
jgi:hypothetical protein